MNKKSSHKLFWLGFLVVFSAVFAVPAFPQAAEQKIKDLEKKVAQLEQRLANLEAAILQLQKLQAKPAAAAANSWKSKASWRLLKKGMNKSEVEAILGVPPNIKANSFYGDIWYYPDLQTAYASFDKDGLLTSWREIE